MMNKVQLLLSLTEEDPIDKVVELLVHEAKSATAKLPAGSRHRHAVRLPGDPTAVVPQDGQIAEHSIPAPAFEVFFELAGEDLPFETLTAAVEGLDSRFGKVIDPSQSAAIVGTEHIIIPGTHRLLLIMALRRLPQWSRKAFHDFWRNDHATEVSDSVVGLQGYRQFHADESATKVAAKVAGVAIDDLEGTAEGYYENMAVFLEIMGRPEIAADAGFIDHSRSVMWLYELATPG